MTIVFITVSVNGKKSKPSAAVGAAALVIVECFPHALIGIFGAANESAYYTDFAVKALYNQHGRVAKQH